MKRNRHLDNEEEQEPHQHEHTLSVLATPPPHHASAATTLPVDIWYQQIFTHLGRRYHPLYFLRQVSHHFQVLVDYFVDDCEQPVVQHYWHNRVELEWRVWLYSIKHGQVPCAQWILATLHNLDSIAVQRMYIVVLKYYDMRNACVVAVMSGHLTMLEWLHSRHLLVKKWMLSNVAIEHNQRAIFEYLVSIDHVWDADVCSIASGANNLALLEWLLTQHYPAGESSLLHAIAYQNLPMAQILTATGVRLTTSTLTQLNVEQRDWVLKNTVHCCDILE